MMQRVLVLSGLAIAGVLVALTASLTGPSEAATVEQKPLMWHAQSGNSGEVGSGAMAVLIRRDAGVSYSIRTANLKPGHAYTVWFVAINNPSVCSTSPCAPPEALANPDTGIQVTHAGGHVAGPTGELGFGTNQIVGDLPNGWFEDRGLTNPQGAEIHLVINDHGPAISELMPEMTRTYRAGCTDGSLPPFFPASAKADGTPGPNTCRLYQLVIFN